MNPASQAFQDSKTTPSDLGASAGEGAPLLDVQGAVATITLRRPSVANRLEVADLAALIAHIEAVNAQPGVLVLRFVARGKHFCSGFNLGEMADTGVADQSAGALFEQTANAVEQARPVTVAALQGGAFGGASDLALACDFRYGAPATSSFVPAARLGLHFYRSGLERFVSRLGLGGAKRFMLVGETFDAPTLLALGYLDHLAPSADALIPAVDALCAELAGMAPLALLGMKKHLNRIAVGRLDPLDIDSDIAQADASADLQEGQQAWRAGRKPVFKGR